MAKKKSKTASEFTLDSVRWCEMCGEDIHIGLGGELNWSRHINGAPHLKKASSKSADKTGAGKKASKITAFFTPGAIPSSSRSARDPSVRGPVPLASSVAASSSEHHRGESDSPARQASSVEHSSPFVIQQLRRAAQGLPQAIPLAIPTDSIAQFATISMLPGSGEDAWESIDPVLNRFVGFGATVEEVSRKIRRGPLGVEGLCDWLEMCVTKFGVDAGLLEGKVKMLVDAISLCVPSTMSMNTSEPYPEVDTSIPTVIDVDSTAEPVAISQASPTASICPGYHLKTTSGDPPLIHYPVFLEAKIHLPWKLEYHDNQIFLRAIRCTKVSSPVSPICTFCRVLASSDLIAGIRERMEHGAPEKTNWSFLSWAHLRDGHIRKNTQIDHMRLNSLNTARKLLSRVHNLEGWKRLVHAISNSNAPRIQVTVGIALKAGSSFKGALRMVDKAAHHIYRPRSYEEADYQRAFLIWKLGGAAAARISHHALGLPSLDTTSRHVMTSHIHGSPQFPQANELAQNLAVTFEGVSEPDVILGISILADEIKVEERLRWDADTNMILGLCREHSADCVVEFLSMAQADFVLSQLQAKKVHLASEATVIATSILSGLNHQYTARPFVISGTCKREDVSKHSDLLRLVLEAFQASTAIPKNHRLYCLASDGDSKRRRALMSITHISPLPASSSIYSSLSPLRLFNTICGPDDITADFDYKHIGKRCRNTLTRQKGLQINNVSINSSIIRHHLIDAGMNGLTAETLLSPNDKQDVTLMYRLLFSLSRLPSASESASPSSRATRQTLQLLGTVYRLFLDPYTDVSLSLHEQLAKLSGAAHLFLALYALDKGRFAPSQLYFDLIQTVKNAYFCVAKAKVNNPSGDFWIILLGTDGLEKVFSKVRTMIGSDTNADQLQLANRIDAAVQCVKILEQHPEWGGESRRLKIRMPKSDQLDPGATSNTVDHINPKSWRGDMSVGNVVLQTAWQQGRQTAEAALQTFGLVPPFDDMDAKGGFDVLCPFGGNRVVLLGGMLADDEREEDADEQDVPPPADEAPPSQAALDEDGLPDLLDFEDIAAAEAPPDTVHSPVASRPSAFVNVDGRTDPIHKGTVLRLYSSPFSIADSKDRLKRVRGLAQFNEHTRQSLAGLNSDDKQDIVTVEDPAVALVRCNNLVFAALIHLTGIRFGTQDVVSLPASHVREPSVRFRGRIMILIPRDIAYQPDEPDWEWDGSFSATSDLNDIDSTLVECYSPLLVPAVVPKLENKETYAIRTAEFRAAAALLFERSQDILHRLPTVAPSEVFPYRLEDGEACFACETEGGEQGTQPDQMSCPRCPNVPFATLSGPGLTQHVGAHILYDPAFKDADSPCGFCLRVKSSCKIYLRKGQSGLQINMQSSSCPNLRTLSLKAASKSSSRSPCTNHPMLCPLCPDSSPAVWKYNLRAHIREMHPTATLELYTSIFSITGEEEILMKGCWKQRKRLTKTKTKKSKVPTMAISEAHTSRLTLRTEDSYSAASDQEVTDADAYGLDDSSDPESDALSYATNPDLAGAAIAESETTEEPSHRGNSEWHEDSNTGTQAVADTTPEDLSAIALAEEPEHTVSVPRAVAQPSVRSSTRKRTRAIITNDQDCSECGNAADGASPDVLSCMGPGCTSVAHLHCLGLLERPDGPWFCDDDCKANAGLRTGKRRNPKGPK